MGDSVASAQRQVERDPAWFWDRQRIYDSAWGWQYIRDVPRSCSCPWAWGRPGLRWVRYSTHLGCPWHSRAPWTDGGLL